jgi:hypothetical protein
MATLRDEIETYETIRPDLEAQHLGKWALVYRKALVDVFENFDAVAAEAVRRFGRGPYLIRQIGSRAVTLPTSVMYGPLNASEPRRIS